MLKLCTRLGLGWVILSLILLTGANLIGQVIPTYAVTAVISSSRAANTSLIQLTLFDVPRSLRARYPLPMRDIVTIFPWGNDRLMVTTQKGTYRTKDYERSLYLHNLYTGETIRVNQIQSETPLGGSMYYPNFSPTEEKMVYFETFDQSLYLFDLTSRTNTLLMQVTERNPGFIPVYWSPDGKRIAFNPNPLEDTESTLFIINVESSEILDYTIPLGAFSPYWSANGEYLSLLRYSNTSNTPVMILRASDGTRLPFTEDLEALWFDWEGCDGKWLRYIKRVNGQRDGFILNVETGETLRVNDHPLLRTFEVGSITPVADCEHFILTGHRIPTSGGYTYAPLYFIRRDLTSVRLIDKNATEFTIDDNSLVYEVENALTRRNTRYRRSLIPYTTPTVLAEYETVNTWLQWSEDYSFALYTGRDMRGVQDPYGGRLILLDTVQGEKRYLTHERERVTYFGLYRWNMANP